VWEWVWVYDQLCSKIQFSRQPFIWLTDHLIWSTHLADSLLRTRGSCLEEKSFFRKLQAIGPWQTGLEGALHWLVYRRRPKEVQCRVWSRLGERLSKKLRAGRPESTAVGPFRPGTRLACEVRLLNRFVGVMASMASSCVRSVCRSRLCRALHHSREPNTWEQTEVSVWESLGRPGLHPWLPASYGGSREGRIGARTQELRCNRPQLVLAVLRPRIDCRVSHTERCWAQEERNATLLTFFLSFCCCRRRVFSLCPSLGFSFEFFFILLCPGGSLKVPLPTVITKGGSV